MSLLFILIFCVTLVSVAAWHSITQLDLMAQRLDRWNRWVQLRIKARRAALLAYRATWREVITGGA